MRSCSRKGAIELGKQQWTSNSLYESAPNLFLLYQTRDVDFPHDTIDVLFPKARKESCFHIEMKRIMKMLFFVSMLILMALSLVLLTRKNGGKSQIMVKIKQAKDFLNVCEFCRRMGQNFQ
jgi:hypothetical protein